jgi:modulator of FtsH protease HflK
MERNLQKNGLVNLVILLLAGVVAFATARYCNSQAGLVSVIYLGLGILVAAISWFQMRLEDSERLEKLEFEDLAKGHSGSAMFEAKDAEVFPAQRSREQFERFFVPIFTVVLCLLQGGGAWFLWRYFSRSTTVIEVKEPLPGVIVFSILTLVLFMLGRFSATYARLENHRLLRPGASYLLLNAVLCFAVFMGLAGVYFDYRKSDYYVAHVLCALLGLAAIETLIVLVLEVYRPRVKGKIERPLYDSRLVGLLGQPEGLVTTAAQALDYQFGFRVSETWFYQFLERALLWLVPLQLLLLLLSTSLVVINPGEQALLERFGRPVKNREILGPGLHLKWPWPTDKVYRFRTDRIQTFEVGFTHDPATEDNPAVFWTKAHTKEENFLVAQREQASAVTNQTTGARTPPVSMVTVSIPVQYQITNVAAWAYNNEDAAALLQDVATREVVRYLVGADLNELMSRGKQDAALDLANRMQLAADSHHLGAEILTVGLQDLHPPVKVADEYEKVLGALETKEARILEARTEAIKILAAARAQTTNILNEAIAEQVARQLAAPARESLFTHQLPAYEAAPSVYRYRAYYQMFERATTNVPKFVLLSTNGHNIVQFDLQESAARRLLDINVPSIKTNTPVVP